MQLRKAHPELTVMEAVDNLSHMAELDVLTSEERAAQESLSQEQVSERMLVLSWSDPEYHAFNQERIKETFVTILKYMKEIAEKEHLKEKETQRGIQAIMFLAMEAAQKIDNYTQIFKGEKKAQSVTQLKEFKELQHFYLTKVVQRFHVPIDAEEMWQEEWGKGEIGDIQSAALKDLEAVREDKEYELFLIKKEDGTPYFNRSLLRHMQLVAQFDVLMKDPAIQDPFLRIQMILDRDAHVAAQEILHLASPYVDEFLKEALKFKNIGFVAEISKALMALMLAGNSRNLMQHAVGKHALNYYMDFHSYLRSALHSAEYLKFIAGQADLSKRFFHSLINLLHALCSSFFLKTGSRKEMVVFIHMLIERGGRESNTLSQTASPVALWNNVCDQDKSIRYLLKQYPNGPLTKTIKLFEEDNQMRGFDPLSQQTQPGQLFNISTKGLHISCLCLPCPISQQIIAKAGVAEEFEGFLRSIISQKRNQRHLLINLQDRTSWHEHARCIAVEQVQQSSEFVSALKVVTLPKNTDFYMQSGSYIEWDDAREFKKSVREQVADTEQCGFYIPSDIDQKKLLEFSDQAIEMIHDLFFGGKDRLVHKNRLDFIEIFYLMLVLFFIQEYEPDTLSFTCKDAIDTGASASAQMYAFLRMMNDSSQWTEQEKDFLLWMLYAPALMFRQRAIDPLRLNRAIDALCVIGAQLQSHDHHIVDACGKLFKIPFFKGLSVTEVG